MNFSKQSFFNMYIFDMCFRFFSLYHNALSTRVKELAFEDLEANEIVSLLTWVLNTYKRYTYSYTHIFRLCLSTWYLLFDFQLQQQS